MEESIYGYIAYFVDGKKYEAEFHQGHFDLPGGLGLYFETLFEEKGQIIRIYLTGKAELHSLFLDLPVEPDDIEYFFANGFQSWTDSGVLTPEDAIPRLRGPLPNLMNQSGDYTFFRNTPKPGFQHSHALTWVGKGRRIHAFADQIPQTGHTIFENRSPEGKFRFRKDVAGLRIDGEELVLHVLSGAGPENEAFDRVLETFGRRPANGPVTGWTSWYNYYTDINEEIILQNLDAFTRRGIPIDIFQIDDGWQLAVGDWLEANEKFMGGMRAIVDRAHAAGIQAGLWLAPFIVEQDSKIYERHRDWLVTYDGEHLVAGGYNPLWGGALKGRYFILDIYKDEVRTYLKSVFKRVLEDWDFDMVKLDFLYAAGLQPRLGRSRGVIMSDAMDFLRECCGNKTILGCGVPLAQAFGKVEYCRIGADIGLNWDMKSLKMLHHRERVSTVNSLRSTISRKLLSHRVFLNDPDVFILREENNKLSPAEKHSLFVLNLALGDLVFTSDNLDNYSPEILQRYRSQFPNPPKQVLKIDSKKDLHHISLQVKEREYRITSNLRNKATELSLPNGIWFNKGLGLLEGGQVITLEKHQSKVFLRVTRSNPLLGSTGHVFPGLDIEVVDSKPHKHAQAIREGEIWWAYDKRNEPPAGFHVVENRTYVPNEIKGGEIKYWILKANN